MPDDKFIQRPLQEGDYSSFHVVKEGNFEDTYPFIDDELLVVCDGCGGAGSAEHTFHNDHVNTYEKLRDLVLPEDQDCTLKNYMMHENVFLPVVNAKGAEQTRTSAFLGSRIVASRFVYGFQNINDRDPDAIRDFIMQGMNNVADKLSLDRNDKMKRYLFATTFVAIAINGESDEEVDIDVYWAGDSRAYYLNKEGLKQLSIDDENAGGGLTNLYGIRNNFCPKVNRRHYTLKKPCMLFTCSDGLFDSVHNGLELENVILHFLLEGNSLDEFKKGIEEYYGYIKNDDTTFALRKFGYNEYEEIKKEYAPRLKEVEELYSRKEIYDFAYNLIKDPSEYNDSIRLMVDSAIGRHDKIIDVLVDGYKNNKEDPFIKNIIIKKIDIANKKQDKSKEVYEAVIGYTNNSYNNLKNEGDVKKLVDLSKIFLRNKMDKDMLNDFDEVINLSNELTISTQREELVYKMYDKILDVLVKSGDALNAKVAFKKKVRMGDFITKNTYTLEPGIKELLLLLEGGKELLEEHEKLSKNCVKVKENNKKDDNLVDKIRKAYNKFINYFMPENIMEYLYPDTEDVYVKETVSHILNNEEENVDVRKLVEGFYEGEEGSTLLVNERVSLLDVTSLIDDFFNPYMLQKAVNYEKSKSLDKEEVNKFVIDYDKFVEDSVSLIK